MTQWLAGVVVLVVGILPSVLWAPILAVNPELRPAGVKKEVTIVFGGDLMFDRYIRKQMERHGEDHILSCIADVLKSADLVVANLEGPITENPSMSLGSVVGSPENFTFTFPTTTATLLARHNIGLVNLGNNHIENFGARGVRSTMQFLDAAGVEHFGSPLGSMSIRKTVNRIPFAFISFNEFIGRNPSTTVAMIQAARAEGYLPIVYAHWGDEYVEPPTRVRAWAHVFAEAGAVMVVGSHPHVVQESEVYNGAHIHYSLGNFVFDQYWNEQVSTGLLLKVRFTKDGVKEIEEIPIKMHRDGRICLAKEQSHLSTVVRPVEKCLALARVA